MSAEREDELALPEPETPGEGEEEAEEENLYPTPDRDQRKRLNQILLLCFCYFLFSLCSTTIQKGPEIQDLLKVRSLVGKEFAFTYNGDIFLGRLESVSEDILNVGSVNLSNTGYSGIESSPDWSSDGNQLVFTISDSFGQDIGMINIDGSEWEYERLTQTPGEEAFPFLIGDGNGEDKIMFSRRETVSGEETVGLFVMDLDGTHERRVAQQLAEVTDSNPLADQERIFNNYSLGTTVSSNGLPFLILTDLETGSVISLIQGEQPSWRPDPAA